jgi:tRNA-specific 2-thiouridylase
VADKSDSQDICFVPTGRYTQVIERLRPGAAEPGNIVHVDGRVMGRHNGIINYTIGQRKGIGVAAQDPLYVVKLDARAREVVVGPRQALRTRSLKLRDVNWLGDEPADTLAAAGEGILARIRSSGPLQPALLTLEDDGWNVALAYGEDGVSPGQACVFYAGGGERLLGGGWIKSACPGAKLAEDGFAVSAAKVGSEKVFAAVAQ